MAPGVHVIEFKDSIGSTSYDPCSLLRELGIREFDWIDVTLSQAGTLGREVLYGIGELDGVLDDVIQLRIHGPLNADDWAIIRQMHNLRDIDLTEAQIATVPAGAFSGLGYLQQALLPDGITEIGDNAFSGTTLRNITIPASVERIGITAFYNRSYLSSVTFDEGSQLKTIERGAFSGCSSLKEFIMPQTVTTVGASAFYGCSSLEKLHFSDALTFIANFACYGCSKLTDLHLPAGVRDFYYSSFYGTSSLRHVDLPESTNCIYPYAFYECGVDSVCLPVNLSYLYAYTFSKCQNLKYIELPMHLYAGSSRVEYNYGASGNDYNYYTYDYGYSANFTSCPNIQTVVCPSATPPSISSDLFASGPSKASITLRVPKFSVVDYKIDRYWQPFNIVPGEDTGYMLINGDVSLANNRRPDRKNDIDIWPSGRLTVGGPAPLNIGQLNIWQNGQLLSQCDAIVADSIMTYYQISANTWYYFTPLYDVSLQQVEAIGNDALYVFRYYDGAARAQNGKDKANNWKDVSDGMLHAGQGYIVQANKATTIAMPAGTNGGSQLFRNSDVTIPLQAYTSAQTANQGWNYVGNPYPTCFDTYRMDFDAPISIWENNKWVGKRGIDDNIVLLPMQAFFVQKPDDMDAIVFHKEGRQFSSTPENRPAGARQSSGDTGRHLFNLLLTCGEQSDQARVVVNPLASTSYELQCDAAKFMTTADNSPLLFTLDADGTPCSINERPLGDGSVALGFLAPRGGDLTVCASRADGSIWLTDRETGQTVDLAAQRYLFHAEADSEPCTARFVLRLGTTTNGVEEVRPVATEPAPLYDLSGRRVSAPQRGLYILNGKKHILE